MTMDQLSHTRPESIKEMRLVEAGISTAQTKYSHHGTKKHSKGTNRTK